MTPISEQRAGVFEGLPAPFKAGPMAGASQRGFTLIEVLIAIAITAALVVALYTSLFSVMRARGVIDAELESTREAVRFLDIFSREIESALYKDADLRTGLKGEADDRGAKPSSSLTFTSFGYPLASGAGSTSDLFAIKYFVEASKDGQLTLYKEAWNPYSTDGKRGGYRAEVMENVEGFELGYYNGKDWARAWDTRLERRLPEAVRVSLIVRDKNETRGFRTIARTMIR